MAESQSELRVTDLALAPGKGAINAAIRPGEIVGLSGLDGHGQERFLETLAGLVPPAGGRIAIGGEAGGVTIEGFSQAVRQGVAYLPRDRRATGIFPPLSILDNFSIATIGRDVRGGLISNRSRRERYEVFHKRLGIVAPNANAPITSLSGGNQQKVLLARWLAHDPRFLLLNDPTRGVDIATRQTLYGVFHELARDGMALVVLSSEIEEIVALCHRVLVFREDELFETLSGDDLTSDRVIAAMFGRSQ
ncbi:ATP-binding cassette domain-containing protein [Bauldia litoralis]|uniref:Ribose transport system ATP-binding protein n=1 Tax=Bauldia litoralis TaxID=665467 RepID=A0A1G6BS99_9HYPH|nr:ATP-binding cassette domain-containing protein [Bauldia litoralis]SDB23510.1 ribose transport system ATP-binding protein [Bauldia litoralis]